MTYWTALRLAPCGIAVLFFGFAGSAVGARPVKSDILQLGVIYRVAAGSSLTETKSPAGGVEFGERKPQTPTPALIGQTCGQARKRLSGQVELRCTTSDGRAPIEHGPKDAKEGYQDVEIPLEGVKRN